MMELPMCYVHCSNVTDQTISPVAATSMFISSVTLLASSIVLVVGVSSSKLRDSISALLLMNMCLSGIIFSLFTLLFSIPAIQVLLKQNRFPALCPSTSIFRNTGATVNLSSLALISVNRCLHIKYALRYEPWTSRFKCSIAVITQWSVCLLVNLTPLFEWVDWCIKDNGSCSYTNSAYSVPLLVLIIYIPCLVTVIASYILIWKTLNSLSTHPISSMPVSIQNPAAIRTTSSTILTFMVLTVPITIFASLPNRWLTQFWHIGIDVSSLLLEINSVVSTVLCAVTDKSVKKRLRDLLICKLGNVTLNFRSHRKVSPGAITINSTY